MMHNKTTLLGVALAMSLTAFSAPTTNTTQFLPGEHIPGGTPLLFCGGADDIMLLRHASMTPKKPASGAYLTFELSGDLIEDVTFDSEFYFDFKVHGYIPPGGVTRPYPRTMGKLCYMTETECPIKKGERITIKKKFVLPRPKTDRSIDVKLMAYNQRGDLITCAQADGIGLA